MIGSSPNFFTQRKLRTKTSKKILRNFLNTFHVTGLFLYHPENIRKPKVFLCFQEVQQETLA